MGKIFVSHAYADKNLGDRFVNDLLIRGGGLRPDEHIFYSSERDTGVPTGSSLMAEIQAAAASSDLMVALITPTYQARPVCIAELGAGWARGILFPLLVGSVERADLEGILPHLLIQPATDRATLNELASRIQRLELLPNGINLASWAIGVEMWLGFMSSAAIGVPKSVSVQKFSQVQSELDTARKAVAQLGSENSRLQDQIVQLGRAKDAEEVREILLPVDEIERFKVLVRNARAALHDIPVPVRRAVQCEFSGWTCEIPRDEFDRQSFEQQIEQGTLDELDGHIVTPGSGFPDIDKARRAVRELGDFLGRTGPTFDEWFAGDYKVPQELEKGACWDQLLT